MSTLQPTRIVEARPLIVDTVPTGLLAAVARCDVSVIIPTFREAENLQLVIPAVCRVLRDARLEHEVIIVDDNSQDGTDDLVRSLSKDYSVTLLLRRTERGLSSAVMHGFARGRGRVLACMDADLSHPPEKLPQLIMPVLAGNADFALGSRYVTGGSTDPGWTLVRHANSRIATWLARSVTRVKDPMSGYFAISRARFDQTAARVKPIGYKIGLELLVKSKAARIVEVPIHFAERERGASKLTMRQRWQYLVHLQRLLRHKAFNWNV